MIRRRSLRISEKIDREATKAAKFLDKRSWIRLDGAEFLRGKDMSQRREWIRSNQRGYCAICKIWEGMNIWPMELDHIVSRGKGGDDKISNLQLLCKKCHVKKHNREPQWTRKASAA